MHCINFNSEDYVRDFASWLFAGECRAGIAVRIGHSRGVKKITLMKGVWRYEEIILFYAWQGAVCFCGG